MRVVKSGQILPTQILKTFQAFLDAVSLSFLDPPHSCPRPLLFDTAVDDLRV